MQQGPILFCAHCILVAHLAVRCSGLAAGGGAVISRRRSPDASEEGGLGRDARSGSGAGAAGGRPLEVSCGRVEEARPPEPRILFRRGGAEAPVEQLDATGAALPAELPLAVPPNGTLALAVCGVGNIRSEGLLDMAQPLSGLVGPVGEGARVRVEVFHSWNVEVAGGLTVPGSPHNASLPASLVPSLVTGPVGDEAEIKIECRNTGNVRLLAPHSELHISGSVVVRPAVDARGSDIMRGTIEVALTDTGNVLAASPAAAAASARTAVSASDGGHLVDAVVAAASIVNSRVRVSVERTANVAAAVLEVEHGNLINGVVSVKKGLKGSDVDLTVRQVGAFEGQHFSLRDGELVDELVDCDGDLVGSKIGLSAERLGNVRALSVNIEDGELVDEVVDTENTEASRLNVSLVDVANVEAATVTRISGGKLLDEALDAGKIRSTAAHIDGANVGNVNGRSLVVEKGGLVDEIVDADVLANSTLRVAVRSAANFEGEELEVSKGQLMDETVDASTARGNTIVVSRSNVATVRGPAAGGGSSGPPLADEAIDVG